ncbi:MAG: hypothetical protein KME30_31250 [Iphinoe sp. HA4291-MV1]|jgi:hypothetical protein|nr:hypothetical protein [Iphinoe sp. HA4291-MV1]
MVIHQFLNASNESFEVSSNAQPTLFDRQELLQSEFGQEHSKELSEGLKLESTLQELSLYDFQIELSCPGEDLAKVFEQNPLLPGAILTEQGQFKGKVSRQRFLRIISRPYARELFFSAPLSRLYTHIETDVLVSPSNTLIVKAASRCLQRPPELLTEPLVVKFDNEVYKLLDVHQLLVAQAQIHKFSRPKTFVSQRKNEGLGRCFGHRVERSLTLAGELIYNPIAQNADDTGILADCIQSARMPQW